MSYALAKSKATDVVEGWLDGMICYSEMMGMLDRIAVDELVGELLADGVKGCMANARAAYANSGRWKNTETGEIFASKQEAMLDAEDLYDYGDPTNAARFEDLPYVKM